MIPPPPRYAPYGGDPQDALYHLLFCDDREAFRAGAAGGDDAPDPWRTLFAEPADAAALRALADDTAAESRLRLLAARRLTELGHAVAPREWLGTVVEVGLDGGLDTLAAYVDRRCRYINQSGRMIVWEADDAEIAALVDALQAASRGVLARIGPFDQPRLAPPGNGTLRMSFLASDGLYFGQAPLGQMQHDPLGGPVVGAALALLQALMKRAP